MCCYPVGIFTIKDKKDLEKAFASKNLITFAENKIWRKGSIELCKAKKASKKC